MKIHALYHVPFEGPGYIREWSDHCGHQWNETGLFENGSLPSVTEFDMLVVMGGPMSVHDVDKYPWLSYETELIHDAINMEKAVIGVCLGSQLITLALGGRVYPNNQKEIGWFPVNFNREPWIRKTLNLQDSLQTFHWHGDTYDLPQGAIRIASSAITENQAYLYHNHVLSIQFHLETSVGDIERMAVGAAHELVKGDYIQPAEKLISGAYEYALTNHLLLGHWLKFLENQVKSRDER